MTLSRLLLSALTAACLYLSAALAASATDARATTWLNVRSGPGTDHAVIDTMSPDEVGQLTECRDDLWCFIQRTGPDGWVSSKYLTAADQTGPSDPNCRYELALDADGPRFRVVCGDSVAEAADRACFFEGADFTGAQFCRTLGTYDTMPAGFDNNISSIRLHGTARVQLCDNAYLAHYCRILTASEKQLGPYFNNRVSSVRVYISTQTQKKEACVFDGPNYTGEYMCFTPGTYSVPHAARGRASSIELMGGARIRISRNPAFDINDAADITSSKPVLSPEWDNQIESIQVY